MARQLRARSWKREHVAMYAGMPRALNGLAVLDRVLAEEGFPRPPLRHEVRLADHTTVVAQRGTDGPAVVLLHAVCLDWRMWEPVLHDDTLVLLFMCCHPSLSPASQIALTLRAVGGLTTGEIARAFLVPEATMTRRVTRAKQSIRDSGVPFGMPENGLSSVLHVLYLIFNEGYVTTAGPNLQRPDLATEAIRLTRIVHRLAPDNAEVTGLLALMLLTDARRPARTAPDGRIIPMDEQ
ncbi:RNA polymerase sigma factor, partial [Kibdelosporangium lantanae]